MRYLQNHLTDFGEIWYSDAQWLSQPNPLVKFEILRIEDGGRSPFSKPLNVISLQPSDRL